MKPNLFPPRAHSNCFDINNSMILLWKRFTRSRLLSQLVTHESPEKWSEIKKGMVGAHSKANNLDRGWGFGEPSTVWQSGQPHTGNAGIVGIATQTPKWRRRKWLLDSSVSVDQSVHFWLPHSAHCGSQNMTRSIKSHGSD